MAQWGTKDEANSAPNFTVDATTGRTGIQEYGNTVFGAFANAPINGAGSPGWVRVVKGEGKITDVEIVFGGIDYANGDVITIGDESGTIETDEDGIITSIDITFSDNLIDEVPEVTVDTEEGDGAEFNVVTEGKIGRTSVETLVAMRGITA